MVDSGSVVRRALLPGALLVGLVVPDVAHGQLARRTSNERILILNPIPATPTDSAYTVAFADAFRERMTSKYRFRLGIIPTEKICEALEASGFNCRAPLPPDQAAPLARFLQATGYVVGWMTRGTDSVRIRLRLVDVGRSGLAGWEVYAVAATTSAEDFARDVTDRLEDRVRAAEDARECSERRERGDARGAASRADRVYATYPNHPSAAMCMALVHEVAQHPLDSIIASLKRAVAGDSLLGRAWEDLGRRLQDKGDTLGALDAFVMQLRADPSDLRLRVGVAAALVSYKRYPEAVRVLDEGLAQNPGDMTMLALKERACLEGQLWACGLVALEAQFGIDTAVANDSIFFTKIFGAAQSIPDTAAMLRWSGRAVARFPGSVSLWRARAAALKAADQRDGALEAYDRILALDSSQVASALAAAQYLLDSTLVVDTGVQLDTARLLKAERLLDLVAAQSRGDTVTLLNVAALLYNPAARIAQLRLMAHLPIAARFLEKALQYDLRGQLRLPANFFLGLAYFFQIGPMDARLRETKSCELMTQELSMTRRTREALTTGRSVAPQTADQLLGFVGRYEEAQRTYPQFFKCSG